MFEMARRLGRRKRPSREKHMLKEQHVVAEHVFDEGTMVYFSKMFNKGIVDRLQHIIARGKEADVYLADPGKADIVENKEFVVVKFFRVETSSFYNMTNYIIGDPRFAKMNHSRRGIVQLWCRKEYANLLIAKYAQARVPAPYMFNGSILAMEFIGDEAGNPAPKLKDVVLEKPVETFNYIMGDIRKLYQRELIHADMSEYNILMRGSLPYIIDFAQAVVLKHPNAKMFLERDVKNVLNHFSKKYKLERNFDEVMKEITH
jgi:RIO kinase 1